MDGVGRIRTWGQQIKCSSLKTMVYAEQCPPNACTPSDGGWRSSSSHRDRQAVSRQYRCTAVFIPGFPLSYNSGNIVSPSRGDRGPVLLLTRHLTIENERCSLVRAVQVCRTCLCGWLCYHFGLRKSRKEKAAKSRNGRLWFSGSRALVY